MSVIAKVKLERLEAGNWAATIKDWNLATDAETIDEALEEIQEKALEKFKDEFGAGKRVMSEIDSVKATAEITIWGSADSTLFDFSSETETTDGRTDLSQLMGESASLPEGDMKDALPIFTLRCLECGNIVHIEAEDAEQAIERECKCGGSNWLDITEEYNEDLEE